MEPQLQHLLASREAVVRRTHRWRRLAQTWLALIGVAVVLFLVHRAFGWNSPLLWMLPLVGGAMAASIVWSREAQRPANFPALVGVIEREHPELRRLLSTAIEQ